MAVRHDFEPIFVGFGAHLGAGHERICFLGGFGGGHIHEADLPVLNEFDALVGAANLPEVQVFHQRGLFAPKPIVAVERNKPPVPVVAFHGEFSGRHGNRRAKGGGEAHAAEHVTGEDMVEQGAPFGNVFIEIHFDGFPTAARTYVRNSPIAGGVERTGGVKHRTPQVFEIRHGNRRAVAPLRAGGQPVAHGFHGCGFVGFRVITICWLRGGACRRRPGGRYALRRMPLRVLSIRDGDNLTITIEFLHHNHQVGVEPPIHKNAGQSEPSQGLDEPGVVSKQVRVEPGMHRVNPQGQFFGLFAGSGGCGGGLRGLVIGFFDRGGAG